MKDSFNSYPVGCLAIAGAVAGIEDEAWFPETRGRIIASRETLTGGLAALGFEVLPSLTNFVFGRHPTGAAATSPPRFASARFWYENSDRSRIEDFLRITVGTEDECARLLELMRELV